MPLTDVTCCNAKPSDKPRKLADEAGLYLLVKSAGKYWRWDYRYAGKRKTMALGVYPEVTLQQAREKLHEGRKLLASGTDPMSQRAWAKLAPEMDASGSFQALAEAWLAHQSGRWETVTLERTRASLAADVFPVLGDLPVATITTRQVMDMAKKIQDGWAIFQGITAEAIAVQTLQVTGGLPGIEKHLASDIWAAIEAHRNGGGQEVVGEADIKGRNGKC